MADSSPKKPVVIILDMARGYGWEPGSFCYEMVATVKKLKDAATAARVQVIHVTSMRRETDNLPARSRMMAGGEGEPAACGGPSGFASPLGSSLPLGSSTLGHVLSSDADGSDEERSGGG